MTDWTRYNRNTDRIALWGITIVPTALMVIAIIRIWRDNR